MSGPKYYSFPAAGPQEAAGIVNKFSSFGGVHAHVKNGGIEVVVSNAAWEAGKDRAFIAAEIEKARRRYRQDDEMLRLFKKAKSDEVMRVAGLKRELLRAAEAKRKRLTDAVTRLKQERAKISGKTSTPFGVYEQSGDIARIDRAVDALKKDFESINAECAECEKNCDSYLGKVNGCESSDELSRVQRGAPKMKLSDRHTESEAAEAISIAEEHRLRIAALSDYLRGLDRKLTESGMDEYRDRVCSKVRSLDVYAQGAIAELVKVIDELEKEHAYKLAAIRTEGLSMEERKRAEERTALLRGLRAELQPILDSERESEKSRVDISGENRQAYSDCEELLSAIDGLEYKKGVTANEAEDIRAALKRCSSSMLSATTRGKLVELRTRLRELKKTCAADLSDYLGYKKEAERYAALYAELRANLGSEGSTIVDNERYLVNPAELVYADYDAASQIKLLKDRNDAIEKALNKSKASLSVLAAAGMVRSSGCGTIFMSENKRGEARVLFTRADAKGAIFDMEPDNATGGFTVKPRGVILSNGRSTISSDGLRAVHSSCGWAEDIEKAFDSCGLPHSDHVEMAGEVKESMYDKKNYYVISSPEESERYLRESGFTEEEIAAFGYGGEESEREEQEHVARKKAVEIKPGE